MEQMEQTERMEPREIHLRDYVLMIKKRRHTLYVTFLITFVGVLIGSLTTTPEYTATTKLLIEKIEPASLSSKSNYEPYDPQFLNTQNEIITGYRVALKVVDNLKLDQKYASLFKPKPPLPIIGEATAAIRETLAKAWAALAPRRGPEDVAPEEGQPVEKTPAQLIARQICGQIEVVPVRDSKVVDVSFTSSSPMLARMITNALAKAYIDELLEINMNTSGYAITWMTEKAEQQKAMLERSEKVLQDYMKSKDIVMIEDKISILPQKLAEFSSQLTRAESKRKELEAVYGKISGFSASRAGVETMAIVGSDPNVVALREQIRKAEQRILELSESYGDKYPEIIRAKAELDSLKVKKDNEIKRVVATVKNEYELTLANENDLRELLARTKDEAQSLNENYIQYSILKRDAETNRTLYEALISNLKEKNVTEETQSVNVWIVEEAETPKEPARPKVARNLALAAVLGLFGGVGLCLLAEYLDNTVKSPEEIEERFGVPILGVVEQYLEKDPPVEMAILKGASSSLEESYKVIRIAVQLSAAERPPKSLLVTSSVPEEGKTTTAINLAIVVAMAGHSVLLVDADLRKPRLHKIFALPGEKGLSTRLTGASDSEGIFPGPVDNLSIMPAGPVPPNPSRLLESKRMRDLVSTLGTRYDLIILDSSPVFSVTDALLLSNFLEATILVTRAGRTTNEMIGQGLKSLQGVNAQVLGVVLNAADTQRRDYYYHYGYYGSKKGEKQVESTVHS